MGNQNTKNIAECRKYFCFFLNKLIFIYVFSDTQVAGKKESIRILFYANVSHIHGIGQ